MKTALIVGGAGFAGSHLVPRLLIEPGIETVVVFDNLSSGKRSNIPEDPRVRYVPGSARDYDWLRTAMHRHAPDTIFHLAANPDIAKAATEPTIDFNQGTVLTKNVVEAARECGVERVVFFSGSGVYGDRDQRWLREEDAGNPVSPYGAAKLAGEALLSAYSAMFGMRGLTFRMGNIVGLRQTHGVGHDFIRRLKNDGARLKILGDGQQSKSYIHIDDVLNAVLGAMHRQDVWQNFPRYDVFNVATDNSLTVQQIAEMAVEVMGCGPTKFEFSGGRAGWNGDVPIVRLNCSKIQSFGWRCERTSQDAMYDALRAMKGEIA